jgi:hypothetical protein
MPNDPKEDNTFWLEFPLSAVNISALVIGLQAMIDQFPVRLENS